MKLDQSNRPRVVVDVSQRVAFSPAEFAALFGKGETWGYRRIYNGEVKAVQFTSEGNDGSRNKSRMMIPRSEVERMLENAVPVGPIKEDFPAERSENRRAAG